MWLTVQVTWPAWGLLGNFRPCSDCISGKGCYTYCSSDLTSLGFVVQFQTLLGSHKWQRMLFNLLFKWLNQPGVCCAVSDPAWISQGICYSTYCSSDLTSQWFVGQFQTLPGWRKWQRMLFNFLIKWLNQPGVCWAIWDCCDHTICGSVTGRGCYSVCC